MVTSTSIPLLALSLSKGRQPRSSVQWGDDQALHPCHELAEGGQYHESALPAIKKFDNNSAFIPVALSQMLAAPPQG